jgi:hypothetical protein
MMRRCLILISLLLLFVSNLSAQDTVLVYNNYKYKVGFKLIQESTLDNSMPNSGEYLFVKSFGFQLLRKTSTRGLSIETGLYWMNKGNQFLYLDGSKERTAAFYYHNLSVPVCFRFDTRTIYFSLGGYADLLLYRSRGLFNNIFADSAATVFNDRKFKLGVMATIGIEKEISKTLTFFFEGRLLGDVATSRTEYYDTRKEKILNKPFFGDGFTNAGGAIGINYKFLSKK